MDKDNLSRAFVDLYDLVVRLRGPGGCPWDARQTYRTVRMYLLEEAYETLDAIEKGEAREICRELGDLLFQIVFLSYLGEEKGEFDLLEVLRTMHEKMIRRHPHVFGSASAENAEEVAANWAAIKQKERKDAGAPSSPLETVPVALPSLLRAHRLSERASKAGLAGMDPGDLLRRIQEEVRSLENLDREKDAEVFRARMGGLLFDLVELTRGWGLNSEDVLRAANQRFLEGFREPDSREPEGR
jgi:tetrapyrrole methylase family protein / MazG family protein